MALKSIKKKVFWHRDLVLHSPAVLLASSSTEALCSSLCSSLGTPAAPHRTQTWWPLRSCSSSASGAVHSHSFLSSLCDAHTQDTLMAAATQWDRINLERQQIPEVDAWLVGAPASSLFGWVADLIRTALQHRLHIPLVAQDTRCLSCGQVPLLSVTTQLATRWRPQPQTQRGGPRLLRSGPGSRPPPSEGEGARTPTDFPSAPASTVLLLCGFTYG